MTGLAIQSALLLSLGQGEVRYAVRYDIGGMERVAERRGLAVSDCMFAHPTLPIGSKASITGLVTGHTELCDQRDTSQDVDKERHIRLRRVELGFNEAHRICPPGWEGKATECAVIFRVIRTP